MLNAAAVAVDITPHKSSFLLGYPHVERMSEGTHDPLTAQLLYLANGNSVQLLVSLDLLMLDRPRALKLRGRLAEALGIGEADVFVGCTHTHSGPVTVDYLPFHADPVVPETDNTYIEEIFSEITAAAATLPAVMEPAELFWHRAPVAGIGGNRLSPEAAHDAFASLLTVRQAGGGRFIAMLLDYSVHPTVLHEDSRLFSGDYPAYARFELQEEFSGGFPVLFFLGAAGNQSPRYYVREQTFEEAERLGRLLGRQVAASLAKALPAVKWEADPVLASSLKQVELIERAMCPLAEAKKNLREAQELFARLQREHAPHGIVRTAECSVFGAEESVFLAECAGNGVLAARLQEYKYADQQTLRIGSWYLVGLPGEFFIEYAHEICRSTAGNVVVATLVNGELQGYMVTAEAEKAGGYEAWNACFAPASGDALVAAALESIESL